MALKAVYDDNSEIPEQFRELYTERDGKFELTGITGIKTQADVDRVNEGLRKEREDHTATKDKLKAFEGVDLEQHEKDQTELVELRALRDAGAGEGFDEDKFNAAVDSLAASRTATAVAPLKRELDQISTERDALLGENTEFKTKETNRTITDAVRQAATGLKVIDTAMDDVLMLAERVFDVSEDGRVVTKDGVGVTPGIEADIWFTEMQDKRPHWWPAATGGGANGGSNGGGFASNPFSAQHWNMTKQGEAIKEDRSKAERMAAAAGTSVGGPKPSMPNPAQQQGR